MHIFTLCHVKQGDIPVSIEAFMLTSSISRHVGSVFWTQFFRDAHKDRVCIRGWVFVPICERLNLYCVSSRKHE
jgi:hypothetical protein